MRIAQLFIEDLKFLCIILLKPLSSYDSLKPSDDLNAYRILAITSAISNFQIVFWVLFLSLEEFPTNRLLLNPFHLLICYSLFLYIWYFGLSLCQKESIFQWLLSYSLFLFLFFWSLLYSIPVLISTVWFD